MRVSPVVASVVGTVDSSHWGQVLILPAAYGAVEIESPNALNDGISILSKLTTLLSNPPLTLAEVSRVAASVKNDSVASLILLVPVADVIYLVVVGDGAVFLKRGEDLAVLIAEAGSISGEVKEGDTLVLCTKGFTKSIPKDQINVIFDHLDPTSVAEKLTLLLHEKTGLAGGANLAPGGAGLIFQVSKLTPSEEEIVRAEDTADAVEETSAVAQPIVAAGRPFLLRVKSFRPHHFSRARRVVQNKLPNIEINKRTMLVVGVIMLFLGTVLLGIVKQSGNSKTKAVVAALSDVQHIYDEGVALLPLNAAKGRERLTAAKTQLAPLLKSVSPKSKEGKDLASLNQEIADAITQSLAVTRDEPQLFYDVSLLKQGASASDMDLSDRMLAILDGVNHTVYSLDISSKNGGLVAGGDGFSGSTLISTTSMSSYVVTAAGISSVDIKSKTTKDTIIKKDDGWGNVIRIVAFGGNLYLLDSGKSRIWKYVATDSGFSDRREYLNPDTLPDLSKAISFAIDGSVWVGTSDGKVLRFAQGKQDTFLVQGLDSDFGSNVVVYASDSTKNVYVLDRDKKRVVVMDKDGNYLAQYVWNTLSPTNLTVSEDAKKILLLALGKIYSLDLK